MVAEKEGWLVEEGGRRRGRRLKKGGGKEQTLKDSSPFSPIRTRAGQTKEGGGEGTKFPLEESERGWWKKWRERQTRFVGSVQVLLFLSSMPSSRRDCTLSIPLSPSDDATTAMKLNFHVSPQMRARPFHLFRRGPGRIGRVRCPSLRLRPWLRCCLR